MKGAWPINGAPRSARRDRSNAIPAAGVWNRIAGHFWTVAPAFLSFLQIPARRGAREFQTFVEDPSVGPVRLTGLHSEVAGSETIVLIVHGLSGNATSPYCASAACAAAQVGFSSLCLSLRGADYSGEDIMHGGDYPGLMGSARGSRDRTLQARFAARLFGRRPCCLARRRRSGRPAAARCSGHLPPAGSGARDNGL